MCFTVAEVYVVPFAVGFAIVPPVIVLPPVALTERFVSALASIET